MDSQNRMTRAPASDEAAAPAKRKGKVHVKVRAHFDRAGGVVDGMLTIDKETGFVHVREKRARKSYSITLTELADFVCRKGIMGDK